MFLNIGQEEYNHDEEIINFEELDNDKQNTIRNDENRPTSPLKIIKNNEYHKNLGKNQASYGDEQRIDLNQFNVQSIEKKQVNQVILEQNKQLEESEECESVIQFQDIVENDQNQEEQIQPIKQVTLEQDQQIVSEGQIQQSIISKNASIISVYPQVNTTILFQHQKEFLINPIDESGIIQCHFIVDKSGFNKLKPTKFYFYKDGDLYMTAKKEKHKFLIGMNPHKIGRKSQNFIGQISCKSKINYYFYDNGYNPKKNKLPIRTCLGTLKFIVASKATEPRQQIYFFQDNPDVYMNKKPKWNEKAKAFTLNFYNRVKISSIKNFQLIKSNDNENEQIYVQFGKMTDNQFNLDFSKPFSPLIAFMIALCNYDKKIEY